MRLRYCRSANARMRMQNALLLYRTGAAVVSTITSCIDHQRTWPPCQMVANQQWKIIGAMLRAQRKTNHFLIKNKTQTAVIKTVNFRIFM